MGTWSRLSRRERRRSSSTSSRGWSRRLPARFRDAPAEPLCGQDSAVLIRAGHHRAPIAGRDDAAARAEGVSAPNDSQIGFLGHRDITGTGIERRDSRDSTSCGAIPSHAAWLLFPNAGCGAVSRPCREVAHRASVCAQGAPAGACSRGLPFPHREPLARRLARSGTPHLSLATVGWR